MADGKRRFRLVDVFGDRRFAGNPLAVVVDSEGLSTDDMLEITRWLNFSETTFLLEPESTEADYKVRIFTPAGELPFAGHPTLGSCHVWQSLSGESGREVVQECGAGLIQLRRTGRRIAFAAPPLIREGPVEPELVADIAAVLGVEVSAIRASRWVDNGPGWVGVLLEDADAVLALEPDFSRRSSDELTDIGVVGMYREGWECLYEVRAFFSGGRGEMLEDPVTGSLNASIAQWLIAEGLAKPPFVASQGTAMGRVGRVHLSTEGDDVWVGGRVFDVVEGHITPD